MPGQQRPYMLNRPGFPRRDLERAIFIPFRARTSMSALNLPVSQDSRRTLTNLIPNNINDNLRRQDGNRNDGHRPRINVSSFFMELTYSSGEPNGIHILKSSSEGQKRRLLEIHMTNTMNFIKQYCPVKPHKLNQFRCGIRVQRDETFKFQNVLDKPLQSMDPSQTKCNTKVIVIVRDEPSGKWNNAFTPYFLNCLVKKHLCPTCITFQSEALLSTLVEQLGDDLHVFAKNSNTHDPLFNVQAKRFLVMSTLAKLVEEWSVPLLILDSCLAKLIDFDEITEFCEKFAIKLIDVDANTVSGPSKQRKAAAKRIRQEIRASLTERNLKRIGGDLKRIQQKMSTAGTAPPQKFSDFNRIDPALISEDCKRIVFNLHERMNVSLTKQQEPVRKVVTAAPQISLLEDSILADIENSDAFRYSSSLKTPCSGRKGTFVNNASRNFERPKTSPSLSDDDMVISKLGNPANFSALVREREKISDLLFNELNQRWRVNGPQRFLPKAESGPYCCAMLESEKQLLLSILQEVTYFETLKDIRNELKDSKKDLEGRLYGYNPDFANLIASAEEFLHGKASCMEPCKDEIQFYKMPVSLVMSDAEVKYLRSKPPSYIVGQESPSQLIKTAMEESTKLFLDAVVRTTCGARKVSSSRRNKTKVIIVVEDNNEALELLTIALWFYEKTPLATFQSKYYYNSFDVLLSLDACRLYFRSYPAHTAKKDEEHIFERWLGVGMNGILRSHQFKIMLIDFPRPGMNLQNAKNILTNRLKIEEKLNNIKSFIIGKPVRKEDNLSTVERLLDEIQKVLEPRDKLLFRKSRRIYMDLKLYKQIEQKSRQDIKALRDWGLPEPENEHELWEKLRNSQLIVNEYLPPGGIDSVEILETHTTRPQSESGNTETTCGGFEGDISDPDSITLYKNEEIKESSLSENTNFLSECEESIESITIGDDNPLAVDEATHECTFTTYTDCDQEIVFSNLVQGRCAIDEVSERYGNQNGWTGGQKQEKSILSPELELEIRDEEDCNTGQIEADTIPEPLEVTVEFQNFPQPDVILAGVQDEPVTIAFEESCSESKKNQQQARKYRIMDSDAPTDGCTRIEFMLPPKQMSDEGLSLFASDSSSARTKNANNPENTLEIKKLFGPVINYTNDCKYYNDEKLEAKNNKPLNRKLLPDLCIGYMSKWGKSFSRVLHKRNKTKFSRHLQLQPNITSHFQSKQSAPQVVSALETSCIGDNQAADSTDDSQKYEKPVSNSLLKVDDDKVAVENGKRRWTGANHAWFHTFLSYFRTKAYKRHKRTLVPK